MKFVSLISSGIDSPVATYLLSKKADEIILVHADNRPLTDENEINNFVEIARFFKKQITCSMKVYLVPNGDALTKYKQNCKERYTCIFCKRMLLRYAEKILEKKDADAIIMGDSLGQVASQTLQNISTIQQAIHVLVLRPLIGFDKEDVITIAKEIGTYDLSIAKSEGCNAVPVKPATRAKIDDILTEEKKIDINELVINAINKSKLLHI